jgi:DNA topoisomerase VI subunit A
MNFEGFNENIIFPNFEDFNNINSNEVFFSPSAYSPIQYNQNNNNNLFINQNINPYIKSSQLLPYYQNTNETNYSSPQLITFSQIPQNNSNKYPFSNAQFSFNEFDESNIFNNPQSNINQISNSPLISKIMLQFREKLYPLLKKFFMDFAKKLINDEPIQIAVIDLDKTSIIDYDIGCYSFPLGTDKFKYKIYNLFDNLKSIARILKLAVIIQNKLNQLRPCTKRELYYENVDLFKSTDIIDSNESDLCSILGICRFDLPIFPSAKGLFCGNITLVNKYGNRLNINNTNMNSKINLINYEYLIEEFFIDDNTRNSINFFQSNCNNICQKYFVLIVEKETLFFNLVGNYQFYSKFPNAIVITGKGYPDYITKIFIKRLSEQLSNVPFIYFGDHDPHGLEIYLNYLFGSTQSCKENSYMCIGNLKWVGLSHENIEMILKFGLINKEMMKEISDNGDNDIVINDKDFIDDEENIKEGQTSGLIKLDNKDKIKIKNILKREFFNNDEKWINSNNPNSEKILTNLAIIKNELIQMENFDYKAEGEYLVSKYFSDFLYLVEQSII